MGRRPLVPRQEIHRLATIIQRHRERGQLSHPRAVRAVNRLVEGNLRLVIFRWKRWMANPSNHFPGIASSVPDLLQEGALGLHRAAQLYDPTRGYEFSTYAMFWIYKGFQDFTRSQRRTVRVPERAARVYRLYLQAKHEAQERGRFLRAAVVEELARTLKISPAAVEAYVDSVRSTDVLPLDALAPETDLETGSRIADHRRDDFRLLASIDARRDFGRYADAAGLTPAERVLALAHADGASEKELGLLVPELPRPRVALREVRERLRCAYLANAEVPSLSAA